MSTDQRLGMDLPGGPWRCRWTQYGRTGHEELILECKEGRIQGIGADEDGLFADQGQVYADGSVSLAKVYMAPVIPVPPSLSYIGSWDGRCVRGQWIDDQSPSNNGPFLLWPGKGTQPELEEEENRSPGLVLEEEELVPVRVTNAGGLEFWRD